MKNIDEKIIENEYQDCEDNAGIILADGEYYDPDEDPDKSNFSEEERKEYRENIKKGNFLRKFYVFGNPPTDKLPFPTKKIQIGEDSCELYDIPSDQIVAVINSIKPNGLRVSDKMREIFTGRSFAGNELQIIRFKNANYIVSPYFSASGATLILCCPIE